MHVAGRCVCASAATQSAARYRGSLSSPHLTLSALVSTALLCLQLWYPCCSTGGTQTRTKCLSAPATSFFYVRRERPEL